MEEAGETVVGNEAEDVDFRRRYTCFYCGFSVEKFKYIRSHIKRFHIIDAEGYADKCQSKEYTKLEECMASCNSEHSQIECSPLDTPVSIKEEHSPTPPLPLPPPSQVKPFNMDLCPYCEFSDKNEKKLRHHILSKHSKELDKIIIVNDKDGKVRKQNRPSTFAESKNTSDSFAQPENSQSLLSDKCSLKSQTSDRNQNNILPFTQSLITGNTSLSYYEHNPTETKDENSFKCPLCDFQTFQSWDFLVHTMQNHPASDHSQLSNSSYGSFQGTYDEMDLRAYEVPQEKLFTCVHCDYTTPRTQLLNRHLLSKHSDRRPHKCEHCDYATKRLEHLNRHILSKHSGQKPYQCEYCDYRAARDDHLRNHMLSKHSEESLLRCTNCSYSAVSLEQLNSHMASKHSDLKCNYTCQMCSYATYKEEHLIRHMAARHSTSDSQNCNQCDFSCSDPESLNQHMLGHSIVLPFQCKFCDFGCSLLEDLNNHLISNHRNGRPHVCPECNYKATRPGHLTRHIQTKHSGLKPYECVRCPYRAGRVEHLHRHIFNKHPDFKPFCCQLCQYSTFREDLLNNHMSKHADHGYMTSQFCDIAIKLEDDEN